jgi:hypoxanthine phosphoribosyltransferase
MVGIVHSQGQEQLMGVEMREPIHAALAMNDDVLVVDELNDDGTAIHEYRIPLHRY